MPASYIQKIVQVCSIRTFVELFHQHLAVRRDAIPSGKTAYLADNFPKHAEPFKPGAYSRFIHAQAQRMSGQAGSLISLVLERGSQLAMSRAQGCLSIITKHKDLPGLSHLLGMAVAERVTCPSRLKTFLETESVQNLILFPLSESGKAMTRAAA